MQGGAAHLVVQAGDTVVALGQNHLDQINGRLQHTRAGHPGEGGSLAWSPSGSTYIHTTLASPLGCMSIAEQAPRASL